MSDEKVFDLDELFGQARAVKVRWQGREYEFMRMEGISPKHATRFNALHLRSAKLQKEMQSGETSDEQAEQVEQVLTEMIGILCPEFPADLPFVYKAQVIQFYMEQTQGKKATETALRKLTGEKSSAG